MATDSSSTTQSKPAAATATTVKPEATAPIKTLRERSKFGKRPEFAGFEFIKVAPMVPGTMQYDPSHPEIVVRSSEGDIVPMTPFISQRLGKTIKLIV